MRTFITILITLQVLFLSAQTKVKLSGKVTAKETNTILEFTAVTIFNVESDKLISYAYTNEKGAYTIEVPTNTQIYLKADLLGYKDYTSEPFKITKNETKNIQLTESEEVLDEVQIFQKKKLIQLKGDKLIFDVEQSGIGEGNSGLETISSLPGMRLDKDDKIIFRGSTNLQVMINGKRSLLTGDALTQYLKTVGGDNIKKIEVITNPSARYDAEGTAGIINIELKKAVDLGLAGSINSSIGGSYFRNSNGGNLYYQSGKWNINASGRYARFNSINEREIIRKVQNGTTTNTAEQLNDWLPKSKAYSGKLGVEYSLNKNNVLGTSFNYNVYDSDEETIGKTNEYTNDVLNQYTLLNEQGYKKEETHTGNIYHSYTSDSLNTKINTQFNYALYNNKSDEITENQYFLTDDTKYQDDFIIKLNNPASFKIFNTMLDVEQKLSEKFNLESGVKYSYVDNDYNSQYSIKSTSGVFEPNLQRSNHLLYKEHIFAAYGIVGFNTEKWSLQAGLRSESIDYEANSLTTGDKNGRKYTSWFPSFSVNRMFENDKMQFSYSRRIQRPRYLDLNPFYEYLDTYNVQVGNPNLQPQFTNAFNISWINKQKTTLSLYTNFNSDVIYFKVDYDSTENITVNSQDNIASSVNSGISFSTSVNPIKVWTLYFNTNLSYNIMTSEITNYQFDNSGFAWQVSVNNEFKFKNNWKFFLSGFYYDGGTSGNWENNPAYDISFRVRKTFNNDQWRLQLRADNVLKKSLMSAVVTEKNVTTNWTNKWETRRFALSVTYNFGKAKKKATKNANLKDEKNRL